MNDDSNSQRLAPEHLRPAKPEKFKSRSRSLSGLRMASRSTALGWACVLGIALLSQAAALESALRNLDRRYGQFLDPWLARHYNPLTGGVFMSRTASREDIQSFAQFLSIAASAKALSAMPEPVRLKMTEWIQTRQNPDDGFFYDFPSQTLSDRDKGRYLSYSIGALSRLNADPLYPLPGRGDDTDAYPYLNSAAAYENWLGNRGWNQPWQAGDEIDAIQSVIDLRANAGELIETQFSFLPTVQQPTGYYGASSTERNYIYLSGAAKITGVYRRHGRQVPMAAEMFESLKHTLQNYKPYDVCLVRNVLWVERNIRSSLPEPVSEDDRILLVQRTDANLGLFESLDGGFLRVTGNNQTALTDLNAASQARFARLWSYEMAETDMPAWPGRHTMWSHPVFMTLSHGGKHFASRTLFRRQGAGTLAVWAAGATPTRRIVTLDTNAADGDRLQFDLFRLAAGRYHVRVSLRGGPNRGIARLYLGGDPVGDSMDLYRADLEYMEFDLGEWTNPSLSDRLKVEFRVAGKNPASSGRAIPVVWFQLEPLDGPEAKPLNNVTVAPRAGEWPVVDLSVALSEHIPGTLQDAVWKQNDFVLAQGIEAAVPLAQGVHRLAVRALDDGNVWHEKSVLAARPSAPSAHPQLSVSASSFQGVHAPENVLDGDADTRWTATGYYGEWLQIEWNEPLELHGAALAFPWGDERRAGFEMQTSLGTDLLSGRGRLFRMHGFQIDPDVSVACWTANGAIYGMSLLIAVDRC